MVTTRSQARKLHDGESSESSASSRGGSPEVGSRPRRSSLGLLEAPADGERLGRGCRVHRETRTLDEQYLQHVLTGRSAAQLRYHQRADRELEIHQRYPEREAAKRAMSSLKHTLHHMDKESSDDDDDDNSSSGSSHNNNVVSSSSSSSSASSLGSRGRPPKGAAPTRHHSEITSRSGTQYSDLISTAPSSRRAPARSGGGRKRTRDSASDYSISDASMQEESIDQLAREDAKEEPTTDSASSDDGVMTAEAQRHANRKAKESTAKNVSINYYMADAIVDRNPTKEHRKAIDRRYRHLFMEDKAEKAAGGAGASGGGDTGAESAAAGAPGDISPLHVDGSITFSSVGGLPEHIVTLREMVLLPLHYPDLLQRMNLTPPRGVLFVGPPGTGKTLMARALANEGSRFHSRKVTFFMRKGADILSKWVGESERQLTLLFQEAQRLQPSIIFFDEIDGLAPTRHTKTEQTQAALVATFLALLDGLEDRGQVVVIGATNRPDTIDPALRRPGRFDRELVFPTPGPAARKHILSIIAGPLLPPESDPGHAPLMDELVAHTEGYSGADIKALCTEASLSRLRSALPQLYTTSARLEIPADASSLAVRAEDFIAATQRVHPALQRSGVGSAVLMPGHLEVLYRDVSTAVLSSLARVWAGAERVLSLEKRDCSDMQAAVREMSRFSVPRPARPLLVLVQASASARADGSEAQRRMTIMNTSIAVMKGFTEFRAITVDLPSVLVDFEDAARGSGGDSATLGASGLYGDHFSGGHLWTLVQAIQRSGPCAVLLRGAEEWLRVQGIVCPDGASDDDDRETQTEAKVAAERGETRLRAFIYYLNMLAETEVMIVVPCAEPSTLTALLGQPVVANAHHERPRALVEGDPLEEEDAVHPVTRNHSETSGVSVTPLPSGSFHPHFRIMRASVAMKPSAEALHRFVVHLFRIFALTLRLHAAAVAAAAAEGVVGAQLPESSAGAPAPPVSATEIRARRQRELGLWRRVEYRRLQLRHILIQWVGHFVANSRFKLLASADLDLFPGHPLYTDWQRHTRGRRIGLNDIMEKLENEEYVCLSQYHDDIDQLVRNVRSFFRSRAPADQRYRLKALELKETSVLNLYRINRTVSRFCEEHKHVNEPHFSSSDDDEGGNGHSASSRRDAALLAEADDTAVTAALAKKAMQFAQRPPAAPLVRKSRPTNRRFGYRRRRRRVAPASPKPAIDEEEREKWPQSLEADAGTQENAPLTPGYGEALPQASKSTKTGEAVANRNSDNSNHLVSPTHPPSASVLDWATSVLSSLTFEQLDRLFEHVMRALEAEVRLREAPLASVRACASHDVAELTSPPTHAPEMVPLEAGTVVDVDVETTPCVKCPSGSGHPSPARQNLSSSPPGKYPPCDSSPPPADLEASIAEFFSRTLADAAHGVAYRDAAAESNQ